MLMFLTLCGITRLVLMKFFSSSIKAVLLLCFFYIFCELSPDAKVVNSKFAPGPAVITIVYWSESFWLFL